MSYSYLILTVTVTTKNLQTSLSLSISAAMMVTMHLAGAVIWVMMLSPKVLGQNWQSISADNSKSTSYGKEAQKKEKRASGIKERFLVGPDGNLSVLADEHDWNKRYEHVDENGRTCCCSLCNSGFYVRTFCTCSSESDLEFDLPTDCKIVDLGTEFMDKPNNSTVPYLCTEICNVNQTKTSDCTSNADITCKCNEGWFNPNNSDNSNVPKECRKIPGCKAGEEPLTQVVNDTVMYTCQRCQPGYFKLEGNSSKSCEPHRVCQTRPGSRTADAKCLNDNLPSDGTPVSTVAPLTRGTQPTPFTTLLHRLADEMRTSTPTQTEERPQTPSMPREDDHQTPTNKPEPSGKPVYQFGYETAFYCALFVIVILIVLVVVLLCIVILKMPCKPTPPEPAVKYLPGTEQPMLVHDQ